MPQRLAAWKLGCDDQIAPRKSFRPPEAQSSLAPRFSVGKADPTNESRSPVGTAQQPSQNRKKYQGTTLVVPKAATKLSRGFSPRETVLSKLTDNPAERMI
jgi:hypothetical protein